MSLMALRTKMLDTRAKTAPVRLVLSVGSRAGREVPLQLGYYLIGRHSECQIRPKSRSVSRRHCLVQQGEMGLQVLDLDSTAGTRVNEQPIQPMKWVLLRDGDILRCGKVVFRVEMSTSVLTDHAAGLEGAANEKSDSLSIGQAWHDLEVAGFLESHDDADRDRRYRAIRSANDMEAGQEDAFSADAQATIVTEVDLELFSDAFDETRDAQSTATISEQAQEIVGSTITSRRDANDSSRANPSFAQGGTSRFAPSVARTGAKSLGISYLISLGTAGIERWKLVAMISVMSAALALLGYSGYTFYSGPSVRVLESID